MRIRTVVVVAATLAATAVPFDLAAHATGDNACSTADSGFCMSYDLAVTDPTSHSAVTTAGSPATVTLNVADAATDRYTDQSTANTEHWLDTVTLDLLSTTTSGPRFTPSSELPNGLIVAGSATGCGPDNDNSFSSCTDGHGTFLEQITGTGGFSDGFFVGHFGIQSVENVNPPTGGYALDYTVSISFCFNSAFGSCTGNVQTQNFELRATTGPGGGTGSLVMNVTASCPSCGGSSASISGSLDGITGLTLHGQSSDVAGGSPLPAPVTVFTLPVTCGDASASGTFTDHHGDDVTVPATFAVTGCPTASFTDSESAPYRASFDGTGAAAHVDGRTVARWHWRFGDGHTATTSGPTVSHTYATSAGRTVTLVAEDSAGALSPPVTHALLGSHLTLAASASTVTYGESVKLTGRLTRYGTSAGLGGKTVRLYRCNPGPTSCGQVDSTTTATSGTVGGFAFTATPRRNSAYVVSWSGGSHTIGTKASRRVDVTTRVGAALSRTSVGLGGSATIHGTVAPNHAGQSVSIQRYSNGSWTTVATRTLTSSSTYSWALPTGHRGTFRYRAVKPADADHVRGVSRTVTLAVG